MPENQNYYTPEGAVAPAATCSFSALMQVQKEVLSMQGKAQSQGETLRRIGNLREAAHYVTAAIVLNEVAQLIAEEVSKMNPMMSGLEDDANSSPGSRANRNG